MTAMVFYVPNSAFNESRIDFEISCKFQRQGCNLLSVLQSRLYRRPPFERVFQQEQDLVYKFCPRVAPNANMIDLLKRNTSFLQAKCNCLRRKSGPMFYATKPFFLSGSN